MTGKSRVAGSQQLGARYIEKVEPKCSNICPIPFAPAPSCNASHPLLLTVQPNAIPNPIRGLKRASEIMGSALLALEGCWDIQLQSWGWDGETELPHKQEVSRTSSLALRSPNGTPWPLHRTWQTVTIEEVGGQWEDSHYGMEGTGSKILAVTQRASFKGEEGLS